MHRNKSIEQRESTHTVTHRMCSCSEITALAGLVYSYRAICMYKLSQNTEDNSKVCLCLKDQQMHFGFMDVILLYSGHQHVSATLT